MEPQTPGFTAVTDDEAQPLSGSPGTITLPPVIAQAPESATESTLLKLLGVGIFYLASLLFMYEDFQNIGKVKGIEERMTAAAFGMLQYPDIGLVLVIGYGLIFDRAFRANLQSRAGLATLVFLAAYSVLGVLMGNDVGWVRTDLRVWAWGFGGLAMFRIAMKMRRPTFHILALCLLAGLMLYVSAVANRNQMGIGQEMANMRVWDMNVFRYGVMMIPLLGLVLALVPLRGVLSFLGAVLAFCLFFDGAILIGATRSLALALAVVSLSASVGLLFHRDKTQITTRFSPRAVWIGLLTFLGALAIVAALSGLAFSESTVLANRMSDDQDVSSGLDRIVELQDGLGQLGFFKGIVGGGLGFTFDSIFDYKSLGFHITIFSFLLKFGAFPFAVIVITLYLVLPLKFLQAFLRPATLSPSTRTALLIVLPSVFGWVALLSTSGGYDSYSAIGLGMAVGIFAEIKARGLTELCR